MKRTITFEIEDDIYEKFHMALSLNSETENNALGSCVMTYIAKAFERASQTYNPKNSIKQLDNDFYGKAINKIPVWALKPEQYNHKIIAAYFKAIELIGKATIDIMERICSDKEQPQYYVPTFKSNYAQMKIDSAKSNGKVFEDDGESVWIWSEIEDVLLKNKSSFIKE